MQKAGPFLQNTENTFSVFRENGLFLFWLFPPCLPCCLYLLQEILSVLPFLP